MKTEAQLLRRGNDPVNSEVAERVESHNSHETHDTKGGWITFPFIIVSVMGLTIASSAWYANITLYAIKKYNIKDIAAAQFHNIAGGGINFFPIIGAIVADSFLGSFIVVTISSFICLLGSVMLIMSATIPALRPPPCLNSSTQPCELPTTIQYVFLYSTLAVCMIGNGGTRFVIGALGADQFKKHEHQRVFFNWFIFFIELSAIFSYTVIIYIQDNISWTLSFGISTVANAIAISLFLVGSRYYRYTKPEGSPFTTIARVLVASIYKIFARQRVKNEDIHICNSSGGNMLTQSPSQGHSRLPNQLEQHLWREHEHPNKKEISSSWLVCTIKEEDDVKKLIKVVPIWVCGVLMSTIFAVLTSLIVLQALSMDRSMGPHFKIPPASMLAFMLIAGSVNIGFLDRVLYPLWQKFYGQPLGLLKRIGIGYFIIFLSMISATIIERKRLDWIWNHPSLTNQPHIVSSMSALWLIIPLVLVGVGISFFFPSEIAFYYEQLPKSLRSTATALGTLHYALGYYLGTAMTDLIQKYTSWLPDDINHGRMDKVHLTLAIIGAISFSFYVGCAKLYKYDSKIDDEDMREV